MQANALRKIKKKIWRMKRIKIFFSSLRFFLSRFFVLKFFVWVGLFKILVSQDNPLAQEFIISYELKIHNELLSGERYKVSRVLVPKGEEGIKEKTFKILKSCQIVPEENVDDQIQKFLKTHQEDVLDCLYSSGVELYDQAITQNLQSQSKTIFRIPPKRILVWIKDGVVNLSVLEKK